MGRPVCVFGRCWGRAWGDLGGPGGPSSLPGGADVRCGVKAALLVLWCPGREALCIRMSAGLYSTTLKTG